jgi:hypothetical protein
MRVGSPREPHAPSPAPERGRSVRAANRVGVDTSYLMLVLSLILITFYAVPVQAQGAADRVARLLNDICISPPDSEGMIAAGEKIAAAEGWKLLRAEPAPLPFMHNEDGQKISFITAWEFPLTADHRGQLAISIIRPAIVGVRHSVCFVPVGDIGAEAMAAALEQQFGSLIVKDTRRSVSEKWFFAEERRRGNCGRQIILFNENSASLMYLDGAYPDDGNWTIFLNPAIC